MASVTDNLDNNTNSKNISETNIDTNLSTRRQREHLQIDATKIQESWEEKQVGNNMAVHGPFEPSSLSKEKIKSLAHIGDVANKNSVKTVAKNQEEEDDLDEANVEIKRRPSGFWRYVNGCFGGNSSNKQPLKPRAPKKITSTVSSNIETKIPIASPKHELYGETKKEFILENNNNNQNIENVNVDDSTVIKNDKESTTISAPTINKSDSVPPINHMEHGKFVEQIFPIIYSNFYDSDWEIRRDALYQIQDIVEAIGANPHSPEKSGIDSNNNNILINNPNMDDSNPSNGEDDLNKNLDQFLAACHVVNHFLSGAEHVMKLIVVSYDVFVSAVESFSTLLQLQSTENEKFVNKFHEKNQPVINVIKTLVHRIGENNKKIFKNSAKTLIFLGRQKILKGSKLVASEFISEIPEIENNQRSAILSLRARLQLCTKSFVTEFGFNHGIVEDGFDMEKLIRNIILPAFLCSDSKSYTYAISLCVKSYNEVGKSFYKKLKELKVTRKALDEIKHTIKGNKQASKEENNVPQEDVETTIKKGNKERQEVEQGSEGTQKQSEEQVEKEQTSSDISPPPGLEMPLNKKTKKKKKNKKNKIKSMSKSKSKTNLLTIGNMQEKSMLKPLENSLQASNALNLKPLPSLKPLKKNKLPSKYVLTCTSIENNNMNHVNIITPLEGAGDPFQKKRLLV